jgi:capsule polysaccharide export protein KpsE/RkpR
LQEANAERAVAVAQQNVNSGTINKLEAEISRLREDLARSEQRAISAEEVSKLLDQLVNHLDYCWRRISH